MKDIHTFQEAEKLLAGYVPQANALLGKDITLERMVPLMTMLGNPQDKLWIIHVAGTSGKTSTAYYLASLLQASGQKVGLTVSPHLDSVAERVQVNLEPLSETEFCQALSEFLKNIASHQPLPTYFELLIAFAYWHFSKIGTGYVVTETGLGGLHDATNIAGLPNKICVITDIGYDHMHVLGNKLPEIAQQKAGIIKPGNQVFMYGQDAEVNAVFEKQAKQQNATLNMLSENEERKNIVVIEAFNILPAYQQRNWLLAHRTYEFISSRDGLPALSPEALAKSMKVQIPGRMDIVQVNGKTLVMDGAHNGQKMEAFVKSFQALYHDKKAAIVLGLKEGKEYQTVLPLLLPICARLIVTTFDILQDLPTKSIDPQILADAAFQYGFTDIRIVKDPIEAYKELSGSAGDLLVITGSFYLLSCVRPVIMKDND